MTNLILVRHLLSEWNKSNRFTGWTDVPLSSEGKAEAANVAKKLADFRIDKVYTSPLLRNKDSALLILKELGKEDLPLVVDKALNERDYGELTTLDKDEVTKKYGPEKVRLWRRSWDQAPPKGESLLDVYNRVIPFYEENIKEDLKKGLNVLVIASHNSLRALVKHLDNISDEDVINLELENGAIREYQIDIF